MTTPRILITAGLALAGIALTFVIAAGFHDEIKLDQGVIWLLLVALAAMAVGEFLPKIDSLKIGKDGVDIKFSEVVSNDLGNLKDRVNNLEAAARAVSPASARYLSDSTAAAAEAPVARATPEPGWTWKQAPAELLRRGSFPNDPRKGVFGGEATDKGLRLRAEFLGPRNANWTRIRMIVEEEKQGAEGLAAVPMVEFFLHDDFGWPGGTKVPMTNGRAELERTVTGGFTIGVWAPDRDARLELDLAQQPEAPEIVKER
jgi:hypothetical protein